MRLNLFQKWALATFFATLFLIFVGGFVRASGAGLGCPDWPHCWGSWWPPSSMENVDPTKYNVAEFNKTLMWVEYGNRLVGVAVGIFVLVTAILGFRFRKTDPPVFWGGIASLLLVIFQGWLGGRVVKSGLHSGMITIHMALAVILLSLLLWIVFRSSSALKKGSALSENIRKPLRAAAIVLFVLTVGQILLGAQVREAVDAISDAAPPSVTRDTWIEATGRVFTSHRTAAWALVAAVAALFYFGKKAAGAPGVRPLIWASAAGVLAQGATGAAMAYLALPPAAQILHLGFSTVLSSTSFLLVLILKERRADIPVRS